MFVRDFCWPLRAKIWNLVSRQEPGESDNGPVQVVAWLAILEQELFLLTAERGDLREMFSPLLGHLKCPLAFSVLGHLCVVRVRHGIERGGDDVLFLVYKFRGF